jgi:phospholipase C
VTVDRRSFLQSLGSTALAARFSDSIARALTIPANSQSGSIADVEYIVILMQENRSFDHYFGTLNGVRGFTDPRAVSLPSGNAVWYQPNSSGGHTLPFHPPAQNLGLQFLEDLPHDWTSTHHAWNGGNHDSWVPSKGPVTMAHLTRADIPFHYALADAFTICDAYHCSFLGPTYPNRHHMWTGWTGNDGASGGPALENNDGYSWSTFPELLGQARISWKIYQDQGQGLDAAHNWGWDVADPFVGNYGCNTLLRFAQYQQAQPGSPLFQNARIGTNVSAGGSLFDHFSQDVLGNNLPSVSWIVAPEAFTEHPNWPANYGAWYVSQILDVLTANPAVWSKTAFFLTYDENDGFFDHMVPPTPPQARTQGFSTVPLTNEIFPGNSRFPAGPYGLGIRVPMLVISPWSTGGWVNSEVFDHTSLIRFIQARFAAENLREKNITPWRAAVAGDLTSAFNFANPPAAVIPLPGTASYAPTGNNRQLDYSPQPPTQQAMPLQEFGTRPACALPYSINASGHADYTAGAFTITFTNSGSKTAVFQVRSAVAGQGPWTYTVGPMSQIKDSWKFAGNSAVAYELSIYGPNGFFRVYQGGSGGASVNFQSSIVYNVAQAGVTLRSQNLGTESAPLRVQNLYDGEVTTQLVRAGKAFQQFWSFKKVYGWYNLVLSVDYDPNFQQQFAGHLETGQASRTDPAIGAVGDNAFQTWLG